MTFRQKWHRGNILRQVRVEVKRVDTLITASHKKSFESKLPTRNITDIQY